jgi:hypothetical protein
MEREDREIQLEFEQSPHISKRPQATERTLVIHAPGSGSVRSAVDEARRRGRSVHVVVGADGK